jgi:uncharacterized protein
MKAGKFILILIAILALTGVIGVSILRDRIVNQNNNQVSIVGQGKVKYQPDTANITLGVQVDKAPKADEALNTLNERVNKIIAAVKVLGIEGDKIKNQNYSLYPAYDYSNGANTPAGYNANQQIIIEVSDVDKSFGLLNQVIAESAKAGANQVLGISFSSSNIENLKQEARLLAISDAKTKAKSLSEAMDVSLGDLTGWWENVVSPSPYINYSYDGMGGGGASPAVSSGIYETTVEITLNYKIEK